MPLSPVPNVVQAELVYTWDQQVVENVLHFEAAGALSIPNMQSLGTYLVNWYDLGLQGAHPTTIALTSLKLTDLTSDTAPALDYTTGLPLIGVNTSPSLPNNVAVVMSKRTIFRGRSYRGRIYHPGLAEDQVVANNVNALTLADFVTEYEKLLSFTAGTETWTMVVVSRVQNLLQLAIAETTPVISITSDGVIDSQRRRLPKRGT